MSDGAPLAYYLTACIGAARRLCRVGGGLEVDAEGIAAPAAYQQVYEIDRLYVQYGQDGLDIPDI